MGIHIHAVHCDGRDLSFEQWDWVRHAGDREFLNWMRDLPRIYPINMEVISNEVFRPVDIPRWRAALPPDRDNPERFPHMLDLLEANPDLWISISF